MPKLKAFIDSPLGHLIFLGVALFAGAFAQNLKDQPDFLSALLTWDTAHLGADIKMAVAFALTALIAWLKTDPWTVAAQKAAAARKTPTVPPLALFLLTLTVLTFLISGCLPVSPINPVTPQNKAQVDACSKIGSFHNGVVIGDFVLGGGATTLASIGAAAADSQTKNTLLISGIVVGGASLIGTGLAAYTASDYVNSNCPVVTGPLPVKPASLEAGGAK